VDSGLPPANLALAASINTVNAELVSSQWGIDPSTIGGVYGSADQSGDLFSGVALLPLLTNLTHADAGRDVDRCDVDRGRVERLRRRKPACTGAGRVRSKRPAPRAPRPTPHAPRPTPHAPRPTPRGSHAPRRHPANAVQLWDPLVLMNEESGRTSAGPLLSAAPVPTALPAPSYRALLSVPSLGRVLLGMQIARIAQSMISIVMILFALQHYNNPSLAGLVAFASIVPGLLISPIAGALLDRHGRVRLIILDYIVVTITLGLIAALSLSGHLPAWLLVAIVSVAALTGPLSQSGLRSLFPLLVPEHLWERVNAVDSNGWVLATVVGAPMGAVIAQLVGFEVALICIAVAYAAAAAVMAGAPDPRTDVASTGNLMRDAWLGLVYTWNNRTLRSLAISLSTMNVGWGMVEIVVPVLILKHLGMGQDMVGYMFGLSGALGVVSAFFAGRIRTEGQERRLILIGAVGFTAGSVVLLWPGSLIPIAISMIIAGLANGPLDIALFTLRQRRTDPAWMGRAFTISMNLNFSGFPIGAAVTGVMLSIWPAEIAILFGISANLAAIVLGYMLIPRGDEADPPAPVVAAST
jgi:MFS family permease